MQRELKSLADQEFDLLVIGGGIHGACTAWEGVLRGLSVALVEKNDFSSGASANSLKIIHGGLRYIQHGDFKRMRESICERTALMRIAPHLVHPLQVVMPTYGGLTQNRLALTAALAINDLIGFDRNRIDDPEKHIPRGKLLSKQQLMQNIPGLVADGVTGGMQFSDAQVYNSERLVLAFLRSAADKGAQLANYLEVTGLLQKAGQVTGATVSDRLTGDQFTIRAKAVVNAAGAWLNDLLQPAQGDAHGSQNFCYAKAINVVTRPLFERFAVGLRGTKTYHDADAVINKGARYLFIAPWRNRALIGTEYHHFSDNPDQLTVDAVELQNFLDDVNSSYPPADLTLEDVDFVHVGLVPSVAKDRPGADVQLVKHSKVLDHESAGLKGLFSLFSVKYTTARQEAERVLDRVFDFRQQRSPASLSTIMPVHGGEIGRYDDYLRQALTENGARYGVETVRRLVNNYGSAYPDVLSCLEEEGAEYPVAADLDPVIRAEVLHAIQQEMAQSLGDVLFRRTEIGSAGAPDEELLRDCAAVMGAHFTWSQQRVEQEISAVKNSYVFTKGC